MRICFAAGGTAGHIYPAIAIAEIIKSKLPQAEFLFFSTPDGMENTIYDTYHFSKYSITIHGIQRKKPLKNARLLLELPKAIAECKKVMRTFCPDIVIGTGGYICYPVISAANKLHIKTVIHESNAVPGLTNRLLASKTTHLLVSMEDTRRHFPSHPSCHHVGTPLRSDFLSMNKQQARTKLGIPHGTLFILSFGGSLGAQAINNACLNIMERFASKNEAISWYHATGKGQYESVQNEHAALIQSCKNYHILPYINNMATYMSACDIVICRAGASTLAEVSTLGKPSVIIPYPNATKQHQLHNAKCMENIGGAIVVEEGKNFTMRLLNAVMRLKDDPHLRMQMGMRAKALQGNDVPSKILRILEI